MNMKREHAKFSLALELLSLLPCWPERALVDDVVIDLELNEADDLKPLVMQLRMEGHQVDLQDGYLWIPKSDWTMCQKAATGYLQILYGELPRLK